MEYHMQPLPVDGLGMTIQLHIKWYPLGSTSAVQIDSSMGAGEGCLIGQNQIAKIFTSSDQ